MKKLLVKSALILVLLGIVVRAVPVLAATLPNHPLIEQAKEKHGPRVKYALDNEVQVGLTADGKSYYVLWFPDGYGLDHLPPMVATIDGHDGCAFVDFNVWHHALKEHGYGFLAVQWWLGTGEGIHDYLLPDEIYRAMDDVFREIKLKPGTAMLYGFSRGSANSYPVAALDRSSGNGYFSLFVAGSGKANSDYPPVAQIEGGVFGDKPLAGSRWVTYGGGKDPNPDRDGIAGMREAGEWIRRYGGSVDLAIEDPEGDHGGFHKRPQNCEKTLDVFEKLRPK